MTNKILMKTTFSITIGIQGIIDEGFDSQIFQMHIAKMTGFI